MGKEKTARKKASERAKFKRRRMRAVGEAKRIFRRKQLIRAVERHPLPPWVAETGAATWPQFLLTYIVSHPAVTCAIPATSRVDHLRENMGAARGPMPDAALRRRMAAYVEQL